MKRIIRLLASVCLILAAANAQPPVPAVQPLVVNTSTSAITGPGNAATFANANGLVSTAAPSSLITAYGGTILPGVSTIQAAALSTPYRLYYGGTSIENNGNAAMYTFIKDLQAQYGDSQNTVLSFAQYGGSTDPVNGWYKQGYGGFKGIRMRGDSASTNLTLASDWCNQIVIHYSKDTGGSATGGYKIDGGSTVALDCTGTQAYNQSVTIPLTEDVHTLTFVPPSSGYTYIECVEFNLNRPGIAFYDASLGGSAFVGMFGSPSYAAPVVAAVPIIGNNGMDSYMLATAAGKKFDTVIFGWVVNDANAGQISTYTDGLNRLVQQTAINNQNLILIVEMGGQYSVSTGIGHANYETIIALMRSYPATYPHVKVLDWQQASNPPTGLVLAEWQAWANKYYVGVSISSVTPTLSYTGDWTHPNATEASNLLATLYSKMFQVSSNGRTTGNSLSTVAGNAQYYATKDILAGKVPTVSRDLALTSPQYPTVQTPQAAQSVDNLTIQQNIRAIGQIENMVQWPTYPNTLFASSTAINLLPDLNNAIASAATGTDRFGKYKTYASSSFQGVSLVGMNGKKVTMTVVAGEGAFVWTPRNVANSATLVSTAMGSSLGRVGASLTTNIQGADPVIFHITSTVEDATGFGISFQGKLYAVYVTATDYPVITSRERDTAKELGGPLYMVGDLTSAQAVIGQTYLETIDGRTVEKVATGNRVYKPVANTYNALYDIRSFRQSGHYYLLSPENGAVAGAYDPQMGGWPWINSVSLPFYSNTFTPVAGQTYTFSGRQSAGGISIFGLFYGGTNDWLYYNTATNTWQLNGTPPSLDLNIPAGEQFAITFTMPTAPQLATSPTGVWAFRVATGTTSSLDSLYTLAAGSSAGVAPNPAVAIPVIATTITASGTSTLAGVTSTSISNTGTLYSRGVTSFGNTTYSTSGVTGNGDVVISNGATDTPGIHWYYGNNTNYGVDVGSSKLRIISNLDESGGAVIATIGKAGSQAAWGTTGATLDITGQNFTNSSTAGNTTVASAVFNSIGTPGLAATNVNITTTDAATFYIAGGPVAQTNMNITNPWGLWNVGRTRLDGNTTINASLSMTGNATITGTITPSQTNGIVGTTTNNSANAGSVGEFVSSAIASGSAVGLTTATGANITSISLTAGDWDVEANANFSATTATVTGTSAGISTTSATLPTDGTEAYSGVQVTLVSETDSVTLPRKRISISSTTTVYLVGRSTFSAGTVAGFGAITARRVR